MVFDHEWMGRLPPRRYEELAMLATALSFDAERSRLSCQIVVSEQLDGLTLTVPPDA